MKRFSKLVLVTLLPLSLLSLASCNRKTYFISAEKIAPYFHEITYTDFEEDKDFETLYPYGLLKPDFGCASVRNGNFFGRNYDFYYSNSPTVLVKMKGNEHRFKSIGIGNHLGIIDSELVECEATKNNQHTINIIPNFITDGINENGVVCNMNIVDYEDGGGLIEHTNPGKPRLIVEFALRYILDNATSAKHAVELLQGRDIFTDEYSNVAVHIMVADINETYIIEFFNKGNGIAELRAQKKMDDEQIMTNFFNNMSDEEEKKTYTDLDAYKGYHNNAKGIERYEYIKSNYNNCGTLEGIKSILEDIKYSKMYLNSIKPNYPTEDFSQEEIKAAGEWEEKSELLERYRSIYYLTRFVLDNELRTLGAIGDTWITMHRTIYDIKEKTLSLNVQEDYEHTYNYGFDF